LSAEGTKPVEAAVGRHTAAKIKAHSYHECSAKDNDNVSSVFEAAARAAADGRNAGGFVGEIKSKCTML
jgi:hypothetical protein